METPIPNARDLAYRRQYYDAGEGSTLKCRFCGRDIRYVFLLKDPSGNPVPIGDCCFTGLKGANPTVYSELVASLILLKGMVRDTMEDSQEQRQVASMHVRETVYKTVRQAAAARIRGYRAVSREREWLPKPLFELGKELRKKPRKDYKGILPLMRWYTMHTTLLQKKLHACSN